MLPGDFDTELLQDALWPRLAYLQYLAFTVMVNIVMLNLLIALMGAPRLVLTTIAMCMSMVAMLTCLPVAAGGSYERVAETAQMQALRQRAQLVLDFEKRMSKAERSNVDWHPKYLHMLLPKDTVEDVLREEETGASRSNAVCACAS